MELKMFGNKRILAIIPARSGSKGIPNKNIKEMNHKPLMAHTIEACVKADVFDEILVSTDSLEYAKIATKYGASVPFLRSKELAIDTAKSNAVIIDVLKRLHELGRDYDYFMLLQPTSPLRREVHILESLHLLFEKNADSVISICKVDHPSYLNVKLDLEGKLQADLNQVKQGRRQDSEVEYRVNGAIYLISTTLFMKNESFYEQRCFPYFMKESDSIDIDDELQFKIAEFLMRLS